MADSIITQVSRDGTPARATGYDDRSLQTVRYNANRGWMQKICCCFYPNRESEVTASTNVSSYSLSESPVISQEAAQPSTHLLGENKKPGKKTLVLDLDETLLHSSFKPIPDPDFIVPVEIEDVVHKVYVLKRPFVDEFLKAVGPLYEIVIFTASLAKYADPVLDLLDTSRVVDTRLFRDSCSLFKGNYIKDLGRLGRPLDNTIIIDNSPTSYMFNPENAVAIETWFDDPSDTELRDLLPVLRDLTTVDNVRNYLPRARKIDGKLSIF